MAEVEHGQVNGSVVQSNLSRKRWKLGTLLKCSCQCSCQQKPKEIPIYHSSICSLINFSWLTPFIWRTYRKGHIDSTDIWRYPSPDSCDAVLPKWERCVKAEIERQHIDRLNVSPSPTDGSNTTADSQQARSLKNEPVLNLVWAILRFQFPTLFCVLLIRLLTLFVVLLSALFGLRTLIREVENGQMGITLGIIALVILVGLLLCKSVLSLQAYCIGGIAGVRLRGAVLALCLHKLLKSKSLLSIRPTITNIFATDSRTFLDFATQLTTLFSAFIMITAVSICGYFIVGPWSLMAPAVFIIYTPVEYYISVTIMRWRRRSQHLSDQRLDTLRELLASVKLVKFLGLEPLFYRRILGIWRQQIRCLRANWMLSSLSVSLVFTVPLLASVFTFLPHILLGNSLDATQAFVFVGLWAAARQFVHMIPMSLKNLNDSRVAAIRLSRVFYLPELHPLPDVIKDDEGSEERPVVIEMKSLFATYSKAPKGLRKPRSKGKQRQEANGKNKKRMLINDETIDNQAAETADIGKQLVAGKAESDTGSDVPNTPRRNGEQSQQQVRVVLHDVNLTVRQGEFIGMCGRIGSGKSTLFNAITGRLDILNGSISVAKDKTMSIVTQDAWLFLGSIRENILFGKQFDYSRYWHVIQICGLLTDLEIMENGDATEVTENGANLSGGQRQRVSLARALYADADLMLLDDPLSAVDNALSRQIFDEALLPLKSTQTTVIFLSHRLEFLMKCDRIIVMRNGTISELGTHSELMANPEGGEYMSLVQSFYRQRNQSVLKVDDDICEEEEEAPHLDRVTDLDSRHSVGMYSEEIPLHLSVPVASRRQEIGNLDSFTSAIGAKMFLTNNHERDGANSNSNKENKEVGKSGHSEKVETKKLVADSLFKSKPELDAATRGHVQFSIYKSYATSGGRPIFLILVAFGYLLTHGLIAFTKYWLAYWLKLGSGVPLNETEAIGNYSVINSDNVNDSFSLWLLLDFSKPNSPENDLSRNPHIHFYATVYICSAAGVLIAALIKSSFVALFALRASYNIHKILLIRLLSCPLSFFERTKQGTIITRFSKDIDDLTTRLPASIEFLLSNLSVLITASIAICYVLPWFFLCCVGMIIVFIFVFRVTQVALRDLRRMEAYSLQPLLGLLSSIVAGAPVIDAFGRSHMFLVRASTLIDRISAVMLLLQFSGRWLSWRLDFLVNMLIAVTGSLVLVFRHRLAPAYAGLALSMIIEMAGILQVATRMFLNTETSFIAVERLVSFQKRLPQEDVNPRNRNPGDSSLKSTEHRHLDNEPEDRLLPNQLELPAHWPARGEISFESVSMSYGDDDYGNLALSDVSFKVNPYEFLVVVGRSGSGKSSIASVLNRLYSLNGGRILIDGIDIASVPLSILRKAVSVVPQEPVLFSGTIRSNLDPYNEHTDDDLWAALDRCALKSKIQDQAIAAIQSNDSMITNSIDRYFGWGGSTRSGLPTLFQSMVSKQQTHNAALQMIISSNDVRFSAGERQLLCLARALVRNSAIIVLDEATASVDTETENRIQATLNVEAHKRTIISIVHRLENVVSPTSPCDRVLVMEGGKVAEIVDSATMRKRSMEASHFSRMAYIGKDS